MSFFKYAVPAVGLAASAAAQCSVSGTTTLADPAPITACQTFTGSIALATGSSSVDFGSSLRQIRGDLTADMTNTTSLTGAALDTITGEFRLNQVLGLQTINFPRLANVGTVDWTTVPGLQTVTVASVVQRINNFTLRDSGIQDLSQINLASANIIYIGENSRLTSLLWQTQNVTSALTLESNGQPNGQGFSAHFPNLQSAGDISINRVSSLDFSSLQSAHGIQIYSTSISNLTFPNLTMVDAVGVAIYNDQSLSNVSFPLLKTINGALGITGNTALNGDIAFPALTTVQSINATGTFSGLELPVINTIFGGVNVVTSSTTFDCSNIQKLNPGVTNAKPTCSASSKSPSTTQGSGNGGSGTDSGSGSSGTATHTGAASSIKLDAATLFGATGLFAALFGMI